MKSGGLASLFSVWMHVDPHNVLSGCMWGGGEFMGRTHTNMHSCMCILPPQCSSC